MNAIILDKSPNNDMKGLFVYGEMNDIVRSYGDVFKVAATIYGRKYLLDEYQVRALQIMCKRAAEQSDEAWQEFVDNVIVYNTSAKSYYVDWDGFPDDDNEPFDFTDDQGNLKHVHKMIFRKDGCFENSFSVDESGRGKRNGFFNRSAEMAFTLF